MSDREPLSFDLGVNSPNGPNETAGVAPNQTGDDALLGQWVRRAKHETGTPLGLWHKVETVRNGNPETHCGRIFKRIHLTDLTYAPQRPRAIWSVCMRCPSA